MTKKSDFAQKLLDDLRLRKQKMAASQTQMQTAPSDSRQHIRRPYQGSRNASVSFINGRHDKVELVRQKPFLMDQVSQEIVLSQRPQSSKHTIDLHMAIAFALENYERLGEFEFHGNHSDRRLIDLGTMTHSNFILSDKIHLVLSGEYPAHSHLQINEISRGAQKLHQILKACSKGLNYDRYSIDMRRELLKGAMDLEASLRMLVNLHECRVHSQKKKIQLLEGDEEDDAQDEVKEMRLLEKPRFSFDRPSSKPLGSGTHLQKLLESSAPQANPLSQQHKLKTSRKTTSHFLSHRRTRSSDWDSLPDHTVTGTTKGFSSEKNPISASLLTSTASRNKMTEQRSLGPEKGKGRIPNVIAKLMGLEELPPSHEPKTKRTHKVSKEGAELIQKRNQRLQLAGTEDANSMRTHSEGLDPLQMMALQENKRRVTQDSSSDAVIDEGKWKTYCQRNTKNRMPLVKAEKEIGLLDQHERVLQTMKTGASLSAPIETISSERKERANEEKETDNVIPLRNEDSKTTSSKVTAQPYTTQINRTQEQRLSKQDAEVSQLNIHLKENQNYTGKGDQMTQDSVVSTFKLNPKGPALSRYNSTQALDSQVPRRNGIQLQKEQKVSKHQNSIRSIYNGTNSSQSLEPSVLQISHHHNDKHIAIGDQTEKSKSRVWEERKSEILKNTLKHHNDKHMATGDQSEKSKSIVWEERKTEILKNTQKHVPKINPEKRLLFPNKRSSKENINVPQNKEGRNSPCEQSSNGSLEEQKHKDSKAQEKPVDPISPTFIMYPEGSSPPERIKDHRVTSTIVGPGKIDEPCKKQGGMHGIVQTNKEGTSLLQQLKQRRQERIIKAKEAAPSLQTATVMEQQVKKQSLHSSSSSKSIEDDCGRPRETVPGIITDTKAKASEMVAVPQFSVPFVGDQIIPAASHKDFQLEAGVNHRNGDGRFNRSKHQIQTINKALKQGSLTEEESNLKQMLITSQQFLTAAVAFFKFHIPVSILHSSCPKDEDRESKLVLDCAYEIMKKKGRKEELAFHPSVTMPIMPLKVKSLDDLVKELNKNLACLKRCRQPQGDDYDAATYPHKILEREIENTNPEANCMWEFGWNCTMFAHIEKEEVIRDVEKHQLNRLIDEIIGDLLQTRTTKTRVI
ncbi:uncharacterized protein [Aristolochia californica]|uniref:uncharacterized protein n=1 Tax=Aristolochia californica TaxID=171875 RepID=UPI0035E18B07